MPGHVGIRTRQEQRQDVPLEHMPLLHWFSRGLLVVKDQNSLNSEENFSCEPKRLNLANPIMFGF